MLVHSQGGAPNFQGGTPKKFSRLAPRKSGAPPLAPTLCTQLSVDACVGAVTKVQLHQHRPVHSSFSSQFSDIICCMYTTFRLNKFKIDKNVLTI